MSFITTATRVNGKLRLDDRDGWRRAVAGFGDGEALAVSIEPVGTRRTLRQNAFLHAVVIPLFADHCGYRADEMKEVLCLRLIPKTITYLDGTERIIPGRTSELTVAAFNELLEHAQQLGAEMGIIIPDPDPAWRQNAEQAQADARRKMLETTT